MKVLFYTDTPNAGGAEKQMALLAKHLNRLGAEVSLAYGEYSRIEEADFKPFCEAIYRLPVAHKHDPRHYSQLRQILRPASGGTLNDASRKPFDLIHIHLWNPGAGRYAFFAAAHAGIPIVTTEHDPFELHGVKRWIKMNCLKKTAQTITICRNNERLMKDYYGVPEGRLRVVHNGIEMERFAGTAIPADAIIITCIAELHPRKGHEYLLRAFTNMATINARPMHLLLVGRGPLEATLRRQYGTHPNIHFLGWRNDIPEILKASDILILPSLKEAFGLVLLEAMASGVAVIGTNAGGVPDIIEDGVTGLLVPPGNTEKIAGAISTLIKNPDAKKAMEQRALERVKTFFTADRMARETLCVYESALSPSP